MNTITAKVLPWRTRPEALSWCPCMDLVVFAPEEGGIALYRLSGQKVWSVPGRRNVKPIRSVWRNDGKLLAVVYDDGSYHIMRSNNGKTLLSSRPENIVALRWVQGVSTTEKGNHRKAFDYNEISPGKNDKWESFKILDTEIVNQLPRLSALPSSGGGGVSVKPMFVLDSRSSHDSSIVTTMTAGDDNSTSGLLMTGTSTGDIDINLYGVFSLGNINIGGSKGKILCMDAAGSTTNSDLSRGMIIVDDDQVISYYAYQLGFMEKFGHGYLSEVSIIPAQISSLIEYLKESIIILQKEVGVIVDATTKFISEDKYKESTEQDEKVMEQKHRIQLFDFLITGTLSKEITKWIETVHEMGFKKWNKSTMTAYESCRKVIFENVLVATERIMVLLSRLRGLASWEERGIPLGLSSDEIDQAIKHASRLFEDANRCMWQFSEEFEKFKAFGLWMELGFESVLDRVVGLSRNDEPATVKTRDVSKYLTDYFPGSVLTEYVQGAVLTDNADKTTTISGGVAGVSDINSNRSTSVNNNNGSLVIHLQKLENTFSTAMAKTKAAMKNLILPTGMIILAPHGYCVRQRYVDSISYILIYQPESEELLIIKLDVATDIEGALINCGDSIIMQAEFVDDESIMLLLHPRESDESNGRTTNDSTNTTTNITGWLQIINFSSDMEYNNLPGSITESLEENTCSLTDLAHSILPSTALRANKTREFNEEFIPRYFSVNGQPGRRVGCALESDCQHYIIFDLDEEPDEISRDDDNEEMVE